MPHIRLFPHNQEEFPALDTLQTWLLTALKALRAGTFFGRKKSVADLPAGSIVLFAMAHQALDWGDE
jgi:hypothetical protein